MPDRKPAAIADAVAAFVADPAAPAVAALAVSAAEASVLRYALPERGLLVRELRGTRMRTVAGFFDEVAAACQFPYYFGDNKDAFDECLRDLDEFVGAADGYVLVVRDAEQLLADEPGERAWFDAALGDAAAYWSGRGRSLRVILQGPVAGYVVLGSAP